MPELPEVETIRRGLETSLVGQSIKSVEVKVKKLFNGQPELLHGQSIESIKRRAKIIVFKLTDYYLLIHLKMTGQLIYQSDRSSDFLVGGHPDKAYSLDLPHRHTHIIINLASGNLFYNDLRKFGWLKIFDSEDQVRQQLENLGPEYDSADFTLSYFWSALQKRPNQAIKKVLLDQAVVAGLGNIYTDEALFAAKIAPDRPTASLSQVEVERLFRAIPEILSIALEAGGTTLKDFRHVDGGYGSYLQFAAVYGRKDQPCRICGQKITTQKIAARTSSYCPRCQI